MSTLQGKRIALVEGRMSGALSELVRRHGGEPYAVPALREVARSCGEEVASFVDGLSAGRFDVVVCMTGVGVNALCDEAERLQRLPECLEGLQHVILACRGPKPVAALKRRGLSAQVQARTPFTTAELLEAMAVLELAGRGVALMHYGERHEPLAAALRERGAQLDELCLYEWLLPEDLGPLQTLVRDLVAHRVDAIAFTSKSQVRHLFQVATGLDLAEPLRQAMQSGLVVAAVGPTSAAELNAFEVTPHVVPENPKMGPMVMALAAHMTRMTA
ncbi:uroporphyrinogen-III synthase [Candidatus Entotheonella palauensis]|uniref:uroporphyrinogen-III synthase n=1 Tax=Candidatus Entotheonella palauensis TaxID=93172 RepID=UPI0015C4A34D|nr:uroporphyrinogen-III synthase [Candidatus Entotheonella palauensis]